jgi:flavin-dependent dehydrogenase
MINRIAIIGAGPSGCALACFLVERGIDCYIYNDNQKTELIVGESLVPAVIPILRRLGIEDDVAEISHIKRGAAMRLGRSNNDEDARVDFAFAAIGNSAPDYAYNIPRPQFDNIIKRRAETLGVKFINQRASIEKTPSNSDRDIQLDDDSLKAAGLTRTNQPDLLIDATGRNRLFSRKLKIPAKRGPRKDIAYFAHFKNFNSDSNLEGQVVLSALECGWSWQIPLPGVTSVGVVINGETAKAYGSTPEERLTNAILHNPALKNAGANSERITNVMTYSNYQLISEKAHGKGWVLLGDALGFVDPMLSPGVFMALESASLLDELVFSNRQADPNKQFIEYFSKVKHWHDSWSQLIKYFYDGRILKMGVMRDHIRSQGSMFSISKVAEPIVSRALARLVSGVSTESKVDHAVLQQTCKHLINENGQLNKYEIRSSIS